MKKRNPGIMECGVIGLLCVGAILLVDGVDAGPYLGSSPYIDNGVSAEDEHLGPNLDYADSTGLSDGNPNTFEDLIHAVQQKRACVRRNGICDHRPNDCCFSSSCRCNLWGSNCRCQRVGLFQKWG